MEQGSRSLSRAERLLERALRRGDAARLEVCGGCMHPQIRSGDVALVEPISRLRIGDVALARTHDGTLVCHRVLRIADNRLLLAGDRSLYPDLHTSHSVLGRVTGIRRGGNTYRSTSRSRWLAEVTTRLHLVSVGLKGRLAGRVLDSLRRRFLTLSNTAAWSPE